VHRPIGNLLRGPADIEQPQVGGLAVRSGLRHNRALSVRRNPRRTPDARFTGISRVNIPLEWTTAEPITVVTNWTEKLK
jgi:hypothetical protein